jgi:hypothetical protein
MGVSRRAGRWLWGGGYAVLVGLVVWSLLAARESALSRFSTPESAAAWEAWRADVRATQGRRSPVERRVPKSAEPPALVLMRDHFGVSLGGAILFSSLLYWVMAWFVMGTFSVRQASDREHLATGRPEN